VFQFAGLTPGAKLCYGRLLRYNGKDNKCHPKIQTLAVQLHVSIRQAQRYLDELTREGFIRRIESSRPHQRLPNDIQFLAHKVFVEAPDKQWRKPNMG
jgi:predicted transcriptional regulator